MGRVGWGRFCSSIIQIVVVGFMVICCLLEVLTAGVSPSSGPILMSLMSSVASLNGPVTSPPMSLR